jgi:NAD(P)-dependent dehydrogenase (short-subunit alcohol dehydrogenase family)
VIERVTSRFGHSSTALQVIEGVDLSGRTAVVTGGASGIGLETARALAVAGARVILGVRDTARGAAAVEEIRSTSPEARVEVVGLDLSSLAAIHSAGVDLRGCVGSLDLLVANAAVMATPFGHTADWFELQFGTNFLGHLALFLEVLDLLKKAGGSRVVALSSIGHRRSDVDFEDPHFVRRPYDKWVSYGQSKTACSLLAVGITQRYSSEGIWANAVHPGGIMTGLQKHVPHDEQLAMGWIDDSGVVNDRFKSPAQGAATSVWAAVGPELAGRGGLYLEDCGEAAPWTRERPFEGVMPYAIDPDSAQRLLDLGIDSLP